MKKLAAAAIGFVRAIPDAFRSSIVAETLKQLEQDFYKHLPLLRAYDT